MTPPRGLRPRILNGLVRANTLLGYHETALSWGNRVIEVTVNDRAFWTEALKRPGMSQQEEAASRRSRADLLDRAEKEGYVVAAGHFHPDDHIGKVVLREGKRFWQVL